MSPFAWLLRIAALVGPVAVLALQVLELPTLQPRQDVGLVVLVLAALAVTLTLALLLRRATATLLRHGDLLVPVGLYVTAQYLLGYLLALPGLAALTAPWMAQNVVGIGLTLSLGVVLQIALAVLYAGWATRLILQAVEEGHTDLVGALARPWQWFGRVFVAEAIGWCVLMGMLVPAIALARAAIVPALILIGVASLAWNLATAALLPVVVASRRSLGRALADGFRASCREIGRWWYVVLAQMLLLGWVTFLWASFTSSTGPGNLTTKDKTNWSVNGFWTGGYEDNSRWYAKAAEIYETQTLPPIVTLLGLVFGVLAVAVKVRIVHDLRPEPVIKPEEGVQLEPRPYRDRTPPIRWGRVLVTALIATAVLVGLAAALAYRGEVANALFLRQLHGAAQRGEPLGPFLEQVKQRENSRDLIVKLSEDPDPRIRAAAVDLLIGNATPARKRERHNGVFAETWQGVGDSTFVAALKRLLKDPDPEVRQKALRTVSGLRAVEAFEEPLRQTLRTGDVADRVIVAESLAHWEFGNDFRETLADRNQPKEVRLAVLRGEEKYGWFQATRNDGAFREALLRVMDDSDTDLRHAAIRANAHRTDHQVANTWAVLVEGKRGDDRRVALDAWIDALVNEETFGGDHYPVLESTESLMFQVGPSAWGAWPEKDGKLDVERLALLIYVVCEAARRNTAALDREPPVNVGQAMMEQRRGGGPTAAAFAVELHRLQQVLRALTAVRRFLAYPQTRNAKLTAWLPQELPRDNPPPTRVMKDYLIEQVRELLAWCRKHGNAYGSPFLRVNGFRFGFDDRGAKAGVSRSLGQVLQDMKLDTDKALADFTHLDAKN